MKWSVRDESFHSEAGCWLFRTLIEENPHLATKEFEDQISIACDISVQLEFDFIDKAFEMGEVEGKDGNMRPKMMYTEKQKREFIDLVFGQWNYFADTKQQTKATFSMDIPVRAMKILSYKEDIVMDPFMGSGTSAVAAEFVGRNWVGVELSENYTEVANKRLLEYRAKLLQMKLELEEVSKF